MYINLILYRKISPCLLSVIFYLSLLTASPANAQSPVPAEVVLNDQLQRINSDLPLELPTRSFNPALIQEVEIRTETDDFRFNQQQFQLRLTPTSRRVVRAERRLQQLYQTGANEKVREEKQEFVQAVYKDLLRAYELNRKLQLEQQLADVLRDRERVVEQLTAGGKLPPREWLEVQRKTGELQVDLERHRAELNALSEAEISWKNWVAVENILPRVTQIIAGLTPTPATTEQEIIAAEIELEDAERRRVLDFVNFEYNRSPEDIFREKTAVGASFVLPFLGKRKLKFEELAIESASVQAESRVQYQQQLRQLERLQRDLSIKYAELNSRQQQAVNMQQKTALIVQRINQSERATPLLLLETRADRIATALDIAEVEAEIYQLYLDVLEESGVLYTLDNGAYFFK